MTAPYQLIKQNAGRRPLVSPRWRKVFRDLWHNKTRTVVVVLSIAVGVFAVGMIAGTQIMLSEDLDTVYQATNPASAYLFPDRFDQELVDVVRHVDGVADAEGRRNIGLQIITPDSEGTELEVNIFADYEDIRLNKIALVEGVWPPPKREILIERSYLANIGQPVTIGDYLPVETPDGKQRQLRIAGLVHDINLPPAQFVDEVRGYISEETLDWLEVPRGFDELHILVAENQTDEDHIRAIADKVEKKIEKSGRTNYWTWVPPPGEHPATESVDPMLMILGVLGGLSLFLSGFLVVNTISALLGQQIRQIGIMKSIGARTGQIIWMYLVAVVIFGLLSLLVAVPLGGFAAYKFTQYLANLINFDLSGFRVPVQVLALEVAVGIIVPLLAAMFPIITGARISPADAMRDIGTGKGQFGTSLIDRALQHITATVRAISRPLRISLRNTIRRKARLVLTLSTLVLGGAIFISVATVQASLLATLDDALSYWNYDIRVGFSDAHRISEIERAALAIPGVARAESWAGNTARRIRPDGEEGPNFSVIGIPAKTDLIQPTLLEGRWLLPDDENAVVINSIILDDEPDIKVGDELIITMEGKESTWHVVGLVRGVMTGPIAYANYPYFAQIVRFMGKSGNVRIVAENGEATFHNDLANRVDTHFENLGMRLSSIRTTASIREGVANQFNIIVFFLAFMAVLIATVGGLGLMGTMSMNVLERTREIGVMRAVGANNGAILKIVLIEGLFIGVISWIIGALAALPISQFMSRMVGIAFLEAPLTYTFSLPGAFLWLGLVLMLAGLASFLPAWNASRLTIQAVLAYE